MKLVMLCVYLATEMQLKLPESTNVSVIGCHQTKLTVNSVSPSTTTPASSYKRGVVITLLASSQTLPCQGEHQVLVAARQPPIIIPKVLIKAVLKAGDKKDQAKTNTFTLREIDIGRVCTRDQLKQVISTQLAGDIAGDFDVGYYQNSIVVSIRSPQDIQEIWNDIRKGSSVVLWCDGLSERAVVTKAKKRVSWDVDSDEGEVTSGKTPRKRKGLIRMNSWSC